MARVRKKLDVASAFAVGVKSLRQEDRTWEADFRALPKPQMQSATLYLGLVVNTNDGSLLAQSQVDGRPKASDLSALLAAAMRQPLTGTAHRPSRLHLRGHRQWQELFPALDELGVRVSVRQELPQVQSAYEQHLEQLRQARRSKVAKPSGKQAGVEALFPAVAKWVRGCGHVEIGDQEGFGFTVRAIDYGGMVFEDDSAETLAEALSALEKGLAEYFEREGFE